MIWILLLEELTFLQMGNGLWTVSFFFWTFYFMFLIFWVSRVYNSIFIIVFSCFNCLLQYFM